MRLKPLLLGLTLLSAGAAQAAERPVVLELFTSQSCSSCPPAEALLTELSRGRPDILALGYHVTYWNRLNWRDTFSLPEATERQNAYAAQLGGDSVFTPQLVVDGRRSVVGSEREAVAAAIAQARGQTGTATDLRLAREGGKLVVTVGEGTGGGRLVLVGFDPGEHRTAVRSGENAGRALVQSNIVRSVRTLGTWTGAAQRLSEPAPAGADAAILLQAPDGRILAAARLAGAAS
jgi:hypothetical protein